MSARTNPWQFSLKSVLLTVLGICVICAGEPFLIRLAVTPAEARRFQTIIGILITSMTLMICVAPFAYFGFVLSKRQVAMFGIAGCVGGFTLALLVIYFAAPDYYPSMLWNIVAHEYLEHSDLRIPQCIIAPITLLGGLAALGCRSLFALRPTAHQ